MKRHVVVCRYNENLDWLNEVNFPCTVYNKGEIVSNDHIQVPNKGRESEAFLRYIIENYETLQDEIVFLQGNPIFHCHNVMELINTPMYVDMLSLGDRIVSDDEKGYPNHIGLPIKEIVELLGLTPLPLYDFVPGAQYIVNSSMIKNKSLSWWKRAYQIHDNFELAPWVYERIWPVIFKHVCNEEI